MLTPPFSRRAAQDAHIYIKRIWYEPMPPPKPLNFVQEAEKYLYGAWKELPARLDCVPSARRVPL